MPESHLLVWEASFVLDDRPACTLPVVTRNLSLGWELSMSGLGCPVCETACSEMHEVWEFLLERDKQLRAKHGDYEYPEDEYADEPGWGEDRR